MQKSRCAAKRKPKLPRHTYKGWFTLTQFQLSVIAAFSLGAQLPYVEQNRLKFSAGEDILQAKKGFTFTQSFSTPRSDATVLPKVPGHRSQTVPFGHTFLIVGSRGRDNAKQQTSKNKLSPCADDQPRHGFYERCSESASTLRILIVLWSTLSKAKAGRCN